MRWLRPLLLVSLFFTGFAYAQSTPPASVEVRFIAVNENALLSSALMGLDVHNETRELLGKIEDVVFEGGQLVGIVLKVEQGSAPDARYVAIDPSSISVTYIEGEDKWRARVNAHPDQLKSAPEFRYEGKWKR
jgi:cyclopropane fatty-acyl-phospholipid synthase-like methyltransferase